MTPNGGVSPAGDDVAILSVLINCLGWRRESSATELSFGCCCPEGLPLAFGRRLHFIVARSVPSIYYFSGQVT